MSEPVGGCVRGRVRRSKKTMRNPKTEGRVRARGTRRQKHSEKREKERERESERARERESESERAKEERERETCVNERGRQGVLHGRYHVELIL